MQTPTDRIDPELGVVRRCRVCGEEWPLDHEFFGSIGPGRNRRSTCRACRMDSVRLAQRRRRERHREALLAQARERYWAKKARTNVQFAVVADVQPWDNSRAGSSSESHRLANGARVSATTRGAGVATFRGSSSNVQN